MNENGASQEAAAMPVRGPDRERRGGGLPWFPDFAIAQGKGVAAQLIVIVASKFGLIAALGSIALGSAAVGVTMRHDELGKRAANPKALTSQMRQAAAESAANQPIVASQGEGAMDGMAYFRSGAEGQEGGGASQEDGATAAAGADGSATVADAGAAAGVLPGAEALAQAAAAAQAGAGGGVGTGRAQLARLPSFGNPSAGAAPAAGAAGALPGAAARGPTSGIRDGIDAAVRQAGVNQASRARLAPTGRRTRGAASNGSLSRLRQMAPNLQANRTGTEAANAAQSAQWDNAKAPGAAVAAAPAIGPAPTTPFPSAPGVAAGEGGPRSVGGGGFGGDSLPDIPEYKEVTPYKWAILAAKAVLVLATVLSAVIAILKLTGSAILQPQTLAMLAKVVAALGGILAMLGLYMLAVGQFLQGAIWTALGGITAITALSSLDATGKAVESSFFKLATMTAAPLAGLLGDGAMKSSKKGVHDDSDAKNAYKKKYGVDPDTGNVVNESKFDRKHGPGASEEWNAQHGDMR